MGERFGNYEILRRIAAGGMAEVFLAKQTSIGGFERLVCIKRILSHLSVQEDFVKMFMDEARIAANLIHPNVAQIYDIGQVDENLYIAMEYVRGEDLRRVYNQEVARGRAMPPEPAAQIILGAAQGLDYAHRQTTLDGRPLGIVHRDISPQNILVTYDGHVKLVDFGVAKAAGKMTETRSGVLKGKYSYMSPEQASGDPIDARTDIFALGITLYEVTTGTRLFKRENEIETLHAVIECNVTPPSEVLPGYDTELEKVVMRALAFDPDARYPTAGDMARELEQILVSRGHPPGASSLGAYMQDLFAEKLADELLFGGQPWEERMTPAPKSPGETRKIAPRNFYDGPTAAVEAPTRVLAPTSEDTVIDTDAAARSSSGKRKAALKDDWSSPSATGSKTKTRDEPIAARDTKPDAVAPTSRSRAPYLAAAAVALVGIAIAVFATFPGGPKEPPRSGELVVESEPRGARVVFQGPGAEELNKKYADQGFRTPFTITEGIVVGPPLRARFVKDGFEPQEREVPALAAGVVPAPLFAELKPTAAQAQTAVLILLSNPPGAEVTIDGQKLDGKTPHNEVHVKGGASHKVDFTLAGYKQKSEVVFVEPSSRKFVEVSLAAESTGLKRPAPPPSDDNETDEASKSSARAYLSVEAPIKLKVTLGSKVLGDTPLKKVPVDAGQQRMKLESESEGFVLRKKLRLAAGKTETQNIELQKGNLSVNATPWAWVRIGKHDPKETPVRLSVYEGEYAVTFECSNGKRKTETAVVEPGQTSALSVNCRE